NAWHPFSPSCTTSARLSATHARGGAATSRPPISVFRRSRCSSCRARRFSPINARWRKATAAPTARRCRPDSLGQLHPRLSGRDGSRAAAALFRTHGGVALRAADAAGLRAAGRKDLNRLGRDGVLLLAEARLPALSDAQARQRQDRELSFHAVGDGGGARPFQGRAADA